MKKLVALFLALALCLSLCTVTAFADTISNLAVTHNGLDYKNPENLELNSGNDKVSAGFQLALYDDDGPVFYYSTNSGKWGSVKDGPIEKNQVDFTKVNKAQWTLIFIPVNAGDTFISDGFTVTVNDTIFNEGNNELLATGQEEGYYIDDRRESINIFILQDISGDDDDVCNLDCETLAKVGMVAVGVVTAVVGTKVVVDKIHAIKAACDAETAIKAVEMPMVAFGDSGDAVTTLQTELNAQGYDCGEVDGIFGQNTLNAVIAFQTAKGLTADGVVGAQTWGALL